MCSGCRHSSDPEWQWQWKWLWLWLRLWLWLVAVAPIRLLAWELTCTMGAALKSKKKKSSSRCPGPQAATPCLVLVLCPAAISPACSGERPGEGSGRRAAPMVPTSALLPPQLSCGSEHLTFIFHFKMGAFASDPSGQREAGLK